MAMLPHARQRGGGENARRRAEHSLVANDFPLDSCTAGHYDLHLSDATSGGSDVDSDNFNLPSGSVDNDFMDVMSDSIADAMLNVVAPAANSDDYSNDDKGADTDGSGYDGRDHSGYDMCSDADDEVESEPSECDEDSDDDDSEDLLHPSDQMCQRLQDTDAQQPVGSMRTLPTMHKRGYRLVTDSVLT